MAVHFKLEDNMLGVCLECGTMIQNGETGCVEYAMEIYEELKEMKMPKKYLDCLLSAYRLQHFEYYQLNENDAIFHLLTLVNFLDGTKRTKKVMADAALSISKEVFFYARKVLSSVSLQLIIGEENEAEQKRLVLQYAQELLNGYLEYQEVLQNNMLEKG